MNFSIVYLILALLLLAFIPRIPKVYRLAKIIFSCVTEERFAPVGEVPDVLLVLGGETFREAWILRLLRDGKIPSLLQKNVTNTTINGHVYPIPAVISSGGLTLNDIELLKKKNNTHLNCTLDWDALDTVTNFQYLAPKFAAQNYTYVAVATSDYHFQRAFLMGSAIMGAHGIRTQGIVLHPHNNSTTSTSHRRPLFPDPFDETQDGDTGDGVSGDTIVTEFSSPIGFDHFMSKGFWDKLGGGVLRDIGVCMVDVPAMYLRQPTDITERREWRTRLVLETMAMLDSLVECNKRGSQMMQIWSALPNNFVLTQQAGGGGGSNPNNAGMVMGRGFFMVWNIRRMPTMRDFWLLDRTYSPLRDMCVVFGGPTRTWERQTAGRDEAFAKIGK
eukprot:GDKI01025196.1.p1 GENE.GDKI01025196.1~~GDKI01025196.1.p1  ORF type:complete len:388 (-),score=71.27 GDKI01025196.1:116-1279(-)